LLDFLGNKKDNKRHKFDTARRFLDDMAEEDEDPYDDDGDEDEEIHNADKKNQFYDQKDLARKH